MHACLADVPVRRRAGPCDTERRPSDSDLSVLSITPAVVVVSTFSEPVAGGRTGLGPAARGEGARLQFSSRGIDAIRCSGTVS